ncbi:hypothetical protein OG792_31465 [Micromonospora sp. NBC_01699]|uniref:hypothetical protein n=1 Tax=Micromonospora sp. NBC_01699 TaxID=2975984 RepID=UPI002E286D23|nr:hypothetical protein [Micromonospora sp. NBC_01699]
MAIKAASRTVDGHLGERRCPQCRPDGCEQLAWALRRRAGGKATVVVPILLAAVTP